jgi:hypothetical protein
MTELSQGLFIHQPASTASTLRSGHGLVQIAGFPEFPGVAQIKPPSAFPGDTLRAAKGVSAPPACRFDLGHSPFIRALTRREVYGAKRWALAHPSASSNRGYLLSPRLSGMSAGSITSQSVLEQRQKPMVQAWLAFR